VKALEAITELVGVDVMRKHDPITPATAGSSCASSARRRSAFSRGGGIHHHGGGEGGEGGGGGGGGEGGGDGGAFKPHEKPAHPDEESQLARHCASVLEEREEEL
jgi:hypothetical protein